MAARRPDVKDGVVFRAFKPDDYDWLGQHMTAFPSNTARGLVVEKDDVPLAMAIFDNWTYNSACFTVAVSNPAAFKYGFIDECAKYLFYDCDKDIMLANVASDNSKSLRACKRIGFKPVAVIPNGWARGTDLNILMITKHEWYGAKNGLN